MQSPDSDIRNLMHAVSPAGQHGSRAFDLDIWLNEIMSHDISSYLCTTGEALSKEMTDLNVVKNELVNCIANIIIHRRDTLLALRDEMADKLVTLIQKIVDSLPPFDSLRTVFTDVMFQICAETMVLPKCLEVYGLESLSESIIYRGGFGVIYAAKYGDNTVALKVQAPRFGTNQMKLHRDLCREALLWRQLHHPHILTFIGLNNDFSQTPAIVSPWMVNGTVLNFVKTRPQVRRHELLHDVAKGLAYLHQHSPPIVHQDIRSANILVNESGRAVLADFGISRLNSTFFNTLTSSLEYGCTRWKAPELLYPLKESEYPMPTWASDIWAFGMLALEIFTEEYPFVTTATDSAVVINIYHGSLPMRPTGDEIKGLGFSDGMWDIIQACWTRDLMKRPQANVLIDDILASPTKHKTPAHAPSYNMKTKISKSGTGTHTIAFQPLLRPLNYSNISINIAQDMLKAVLGPDDSNKKAIEALHRVCIVADPSLDNSSTLLSCIGEYSNATRAKTELNKARSLSSENYIISVLTLLTSTFSTLQILEFHERFGARLREAIHNN